MHHTLVIMIFLLNICFLFKSMCTTPPIIKIQLKLNKCLTNSRNTHHESWWRGGSWLIVRILNDADIIHVSLCNSTTGLKYILNKDATSFIFNRLSGWNKPTCRDHVTINSRDDADDRDGNMKIWILVWAMFFLATFYIFKRIYTFLAWINDVSRITRCLGLG